VLTTSELREYLSKTLPDYMIPSAFVRLDAMPVTPNGKIDCRALPEPEKTRPELRITYVAPQTDIEANLARIWGEVLHLDRVGSHDNFFDLGGHSLAASRVISRVIQTFQLELPVKMLFDAPTVAEMGAVITQHQAKQASDLKLGQMLHEVEAMTEEDARNKLEGETVWSTVLDGHE
jgi:acyl carrier protein